MSVGVKGVYVVPDVVLDELERFSRGCVVTINNFLFSIRSFESCVSPNDILFDEIQNREHVFYCQISFFE